MAHFSTFINLTPHPVSIIDRAGTTHTIEPCGVVARVAAIPGEDLEDWDGVPMQAAGTFGAVTFARDGQPVELADLPTTPSLGTPRYIVSLMVAEALRAQDLERSRFCRPDTGPDAVREGGQVKAVRRFIKA